MQTVMYGVDGVGFFDPNFDWTGSQGPPAQSVKGWEHTRPTGSRIDELAMTPMRNLLSIELRARCAACLPLITAGPQIPVSHRYTICERARQIAYYGVERV